MSESTTTAFVKNLFLGNITSECVVPYPFKPFDKDFLDMIDAVGQFMKELDPRKTDKEHTIAPDVMQGLKEMGLFGMIIDEKYGGLGFNQTQYCKIIEELSQYDGSIAITVGAHQSIGLKGLLLFGTEEQKQKYFPKLATGEMLAAFALTEPGAGSDAASIHTKAEPDGDGYRLTGEKIWITNGGIADFFTVFAITPGEEKKGMKPITAFIVERSMEGFSSGKEEDKMGLCGSSTTPIAFDHVYVPKENILGEVGEGFKIAMSILNQGRLGLACGSIGAIKKGAALATAHAQERKQFGQPLISFELIREKLAAMYADAYALESMVYATSTMIDRGDEDYSIETAICKTMATELAWRHVNEALQIAGGIGYMREYPYELMVRDLRINMIFEGANEVMKLFIGLSGFQHLGKYLSSLQAEMGDFFESPLQSVESIYEYVHHRSAQVGLAPSSKLMGIHADVEKWADMFNRRVRTLSSASERLLRRYRKDIRHQQCQTRRIAEVVSDLYLLACTLSRTSQILSDPAKADLHPLVLKFMKLTGHKVKRQTAENLRRLERNENDTINQLVEKEYITKGYPTHF